MSVSSTAYRVVSIGHANLDIYMRVSRLPEPDSREVAHEVYICPGGAALNYAVATSTFGHESYLVACVGEDILGDLILSYLLERRVRVDFVIRSSKTQTGIVVVLLDSRGIKYMIAYSGANVNVKVPDNVRADLVYIVLAEPNILEDVVRAVSRCESLVSLGLRTQIAQLGLEYLATLRDTLGKELFTIFLNKPELEYLTGTRDISVALRTIKQIAGKIAREVIVTLGDEGSVIITEDTILKIPAIRLGKPADTTGAGDVYAAVYNLSRLCGLDVESSAKLASMVAGAKVLRRGASNMPSLEELMQYALKLGLVDLLQRITALR